MRHEVWPLICNLKGIKTDSHLFYDELLGKENWACEEEIRKDVTRTFQNNIFFLQHVGKEAITDILKAVSCAYPTLGYTQGMSFMAGMFCFYLSNEEAFWMFVYLFEKRSMLVYFTELEHLERHISIFNDLLSRYMKKLKAHLDSHQVVGEIYMSKYIMTFFTGILPVHYCCRIFDIFIFESEKIIFRAILGVFKCIEPVLLSFKTPDDVLKVITNPFPYMKQVSEDQFIEICHTFTFSQTYLAKLDYQYTLNKKTG